jgi:antitoxin CptB
MTPTLVTSCTALPPEGANFSRGGPSKNSPVVSANPDELIGERQLSRLRWSCRRGLLENDLFIERFFKRYERTLNLRQAQGLSALMDLSDNDLLDLHLVRKEIGAVNAELDRPEIREVLSMLRQTA